MTIEDNQLDDTAAFSLADLITRLNTLKWLTLSDDDITSNGWQSIFAALETANSSELNNLELYGDRITDEATTSLANAVASSNTLKDLSFYCGEITSTGLRELAIIWKTQILL